MEDLRTLLPALLAGCCLLISSAAPLPAQQTKKPAGAGSGSATAGKPAGTPSGTAGGAKKKPPVRPVQGTDDDLEAPAPRTRARRADEDDAPPAKGAPRRSVPARTPADSREDDTEGADSGRLPRPEAQPLRIQKLSPELEQILKDWEQQTAKIQKLQGDTKYREIEQAFAVEFRGEGRFAFEAPDRGNYELQPAKISKGETSSIKNEQSEPYRLEPKAAERWVCTGKEILKIDESQKTYEVVEIPEERRGDRIIEAPLPFLFGMKAEQAKQRYQIELKKETDKDIALQLRPNWSGDAANWSKATVIISKSNYLPREVRLISPGGTSMRIHTFENVKVNSNNIFRSLFGDDPFRPKLKNYKVVMNDRPAPDSPVVSDKAGVGGAKARQASGEAPAEKTAAKPAREAPARTADSGADRKKPAAGTKK